MKNIFTILLLLVTLTSCAYADKPTNYIKATEAQFVLKTNVSSQDADGNFIYYPAELIGEVRAITQDNGMRRIIKRKFIGKPQNALFTSKQIHAALPSTLKKMYKDLYLEAINIDPSK